MMRLRGDSAPHFFASDDIVARWPRAAVRRCGDFAANPEVCTSPFRSLSSQALDQ